LKASSEDVASRLQLSREREISGARYSFRFMQPFIELVG